MTDTLTLEPTAVVRDLAERARVASRRLALLTRAEKDAALLALADAVVERTVDKVAAEDIKAAAKEAEAEEKAAEK